MDLLITGGRLVSGGRADLLVDRGRIAAIGSFPAAGAAQVIDATGLVVAPGFVDGHRHVWQAPLRGIGADMTLPEYLAVVQGRALAAMGPAEVRRATLLGAAEALDAGITTVLDFNNTTRTPEHTDAVLDAYATAGLRAVVGHGNPDDQRDVERVAGLRGRVTGAVAVFGTAWGSFDDALRQIDLARRLGVIATMHAAGGPGSPIEQLHEAGALGPHLHLVHVNGMTEEQAKLLAGTGTGVTVTPVVEATMGHGRSPWSTFLAAGGRAGLGTDVPVNAPPDLFEPLRDTLRSHRLSTGAMHPAAGLLPAITADSARAIGLGDHVGAIATGMRADLVLLGGLAHLPESADLAGAVVTTLGPADVHTVIVDGRIRKSEGRLVDLDLAALRRLCHTESD
ncbi:amidohydrolase family protein [Actinoplanes sp. NEAU-A12]|uniref:Amidohydrolase family protein n=1 Tax=Actinoplanes sandaracinus TaxID=3045177 RepID=A0ABT6WKS5_9ACTN|nr:amidohydrolase family protein [Actinoplanes sandaracinus]MDI6100331.1 amidohydrolase family protein [Actinoplanes sandaracinus]